MSLVHLYQFSEEDEKDPHSTKHSAHGSFEGCIKNRRTTDLLFLIGLIAMWVVMTIIGSSTIKRGDPFRLISPINDQGLVCGHDSAVKDDKYFYTVLDNGIGVCASSCPTTNSSFTSTDGDDYYCLDSIMTTFGTTSITLSTYISNNCFTNGEYDFTTYCGCALKLKSTSIFHRCTIDDAEYRNLFKSQQAKGYLTSFVADILQARGLVFGLGVGLAFIMAFVWVSFLRFECLSLIFVWSSIIIIQAAFAVMVILAYSTAETWKKEDPAQHTSQEIRGIQFLSAICLGVAVLWFILMCIWRSAINLAVKTISLTAECIQSMPLIVLTPAVQTIGVVLFLAPWGAYCYFIASSGTFIEEEYTFPGAPMSFTYQKYHLSDTSEGRLWYLFFCFLWTTEFISAMGQLIISIAVCKWYFTKPDERGVLSGSSQLCGAYATAIRFHAGTAAFGSLLVAIVEYTRWVILYIEKHTKGIQHNIVMRYVFCCIQCCLWCLEKCLRFISRNAYCQTAIHGSSFCMAAKEAFFLICRNVFRVGALAVVSGVALFIGKVFVVSVVGSVAYYIFTSKFGTEIQGFAAPTILVMVLAYAIASMFTEVFETAVNCMLQCYISDEEFHGGKAIYCTSSMKSFIDKNGKITQEEFQKSNPRPPSSRNLDASGFQAVPQTGSAVDFGVGSGGAQDVHSI